MYPNSLQIFHLCCIHGYGYEREKSKPCCHTLFEVKQTKNSYTTILENVGNNKENNCKPDYSRSELLCHLLVEDK
jgi:hypothetical protein